MKVQGSDLNADNMGVRNRGIKFVCLFAILTAATGFAQDTQHGHAWTYDGAEGPAHWGELKGEYGACKAGKEQSPIDIRHSQKADLAELRFEYKDSPLRIVNNGHTIQVNYAPGSFIAMEEKRYELRQFHFHHPSEERIQGKSSDMVIHLVHAGSDGSLAVVAVLLKKGASNAGLDKVWAHLPKTEGQEQEIPGVQISAGALLPHNAGYYTFRGSLTTPPCSEGVTWYVLKTPMEISAEQIDIFHKIYPHNARPVQPTGERLVRSSR